MADLDRALLLPETRAHKLSDWDLRQSIRNLGLQNPVLYHNGSLLDGARRVYICQVLRIPQRVQHVNETVEAARMLWREHPQRAWRTFYRRGMRPVQLAHLFGCSLSEIPSSERIRDEMHPRKSIAGTTRAVLPRIEVPRAELEIAKRLCREHGTTLSARIRELVHELANQKGHSSAGETESYSLKSSCR